MRRTCISEWGRWCCVLGLVLLTCVGPRKSAWGEPAPRGAKSVTPGEITIVVSPVSIGAVWRIEGDVDLDSTMVMACRRAGSEADFGAMPTMRAWPELRTGDAPLCENR